MAEKRHFQVIETTNGTETISYHSAHTGRDILEKFGVFLTPVNPVKASRAKAGFPYGTANGGTVSYKRISRDEYETGIDAVDKTEAAQAAAPEGVEGQDRESYSDTQDRESYAVTGEAAPAPIVVTLEARITTAPKAAPLSIPPRGRKARAMFGQVYSRKTKAAPVVFDFLT